MDIKRVIYKINKVISFGFFGFGAFLITLCVLIPLAYLPILNKDYDRLGRAVVSKCFAIFVWYMKATNELKIETFNLEKLDSQKPMLICPNHPTLLDIVILLSLYPNTTCITKASLAKNPIMKRLVVDLYIPNSLNFKDTQKAFEKALDNNSHIIIFPEGTRTRFETKQFKYQRSSAHIALLSKCDILPVYIEATQPSGLGKNDKFFDIPQNYVINYKIEFKDKLSFRDYSNLPRSIGARKFTEDLKIKTFQNTKYDLKRNKHGKIT